ncbi:sulfite exporter TauE/SafE family protein [Candidatus Gracilibacteria bacterium]|nr:sulfite exporter TauE/SafE family protein [Candidatus Gracilibacteria bacterium]
MKQKLPVYGMHCKSCELLLDSKLSEISGVKVKKVSFKDNFVEFEIDDLKNLNSVRKTISSLGYDLEKKKVKKNNIFDYIIIFLIFIIFGIIYKLFGDNNLFSSFGNIANPSLIIVLLIGVVASLSTCLAVTGGIVIGFSKYLDNSKGNLSHFFIQIKFHIGRILGFAIGGGILGLIGGTLGSIVMLNKLLLLITGGFMLYMGLHLLQIIPSIKFTLPKFIGNKVLNIKNPAFAPIVGALTFFLPCGFTQSMQMYAVSSGGFISGALIMGAFALGTMPVLFLVGFGSSYFKDKNIKYINMVMGVIVIYFGIFMLSGLANLISFKKTPSQTNQNIVNENISYEQKTILHNGWSLGEKEIYLKAGGYYKLNIIPTKNGTGCMSTLLIPGIDETPHKIIAGEPISILINDAKPGKYNIVCSTMGMKQGEIIIN